MIKPLPREPEKAFVRLKAYIDMGPTRTLRKLATQLGCSVELLRDNSRKFQWQKRVQQHVVDEEEARTKAEQQAKLEAARKREQFRTDIDEHERDAFYMLRRKLAEVAEFPVYRQKYLKNRFAKYPDGTDILDKDGNKIPITVVMQPLIASVQDIAKVAQMASQLARLNQGMSMGKHEVTGEDGTPLAAVQPIINIVVRRDKQSEELRKQEREFLKRNPDFIASRKSNGS